MTIQKMIFPISYTEDNVGLYFNSSDEVKMIQNTGTMFLTKKSSFETNTYYNILSYKKLVQYTVISNLYLKVKANGKFNIEIYGIEKIGCEVKRKLVHTYSVIESEISDLFFPIDTDSGISFYYFKVIAEEDSTILQCEYVSDIDIDQIRPIKLAIGICTYKREKEVERNITTLKSCIEELKIASNKNQICVFMIDNGCTLSKEKYESNDVYIIYNKNLGGSAGFTRALIEALDMSSKCFDNVLLMDDDAVITKDSIVRTLQLLSILKPEYQDAFIGGALFDKDKKNVMLENGALWNYGEIIPMKHNLDMNQEENVVLSEQEECIDYFGWWYCCIPITPSLSDNMPLPFFIHGDDIEFGIRNMRKAITLNGINIWHENFRDRYNSADEYYFWRNKTIINSIHCHQYHALKCCHDVFSHGIREIIFYRYNNFEIFEKAINDFLKGPGHLSNCDYEALNKWITKKRYVLHKADIEEQKLIEKVDGSSSRLDHKKYSVTEKMRCMFTLNGLFMCKNRIMAVSVFDAKIPVAYATDRIINYGNDDDFIFYTYRDVKKTLKYLRKLVMLLFRTFINYTNVSKMYRNDVCTLSTEAFWKEYLHI